MDYIYFRSLLLTYTFFKYFQEIKYKNVPVGRAMAYSFHRNAIKFFNCKGLTFPKNWQKQKINLYNLLIKNEPLIKIPYKKDVNKQQKIIYSPYSFEGLNISPNDSLILGRNYSEKERLKGINVPFIIPEKLLDLNTESYFILINQVKKIIKYKNVPDYFKTKYFIQWFALNLQPVMKIIDGLEKIFSLYQIKGIVQHSSVHPIGYLLVHMGKQRGITTINLQYGLNDEYQLFSTYVDYYVAWGGIHKKRLTRLGVPEKKFYLLGNARFDPIFTKGWKSKKDLAKIFNFSEEKVVFFYPDQAISVQRNQKVMNVILNSLLPYKDKIVLLVKNHPRQRKGSLPDEYRNKFPFVRKVTSQNVHLNDILNSVDAVFIQFSTIGVEALLFNKPIIIVSLFPNTHKHEYTYYSSSKLLISAENQQQLNEIVSYFIKDPSYRCSVLQKEKKYLKASYKVTLAASNISKFIYDKSR